ncbi:MAG TPA: helix-turn-helix domain-containing protein [Thermoplasmata archaeon]|nr:helix-turn-helix domain-containing protein [Thermoplasmata archaeon]
MKLSEASEALERVGLSRYEALVFVNLARSGAVTAGELARASGVNRVQTYRALESLESRGLVEVTIDRPRRYAARAIDDVFEMIAEEKRAELERLDAVRKSVSGAWPRISGQRRESPSVRLQVIKGRTQIYRTLRQLIASAKAEVLAFTTAKGLQRSYRAGINEALLEAMRRGVKPRLIADINESNVALMARVAKNVPLRHLERQRGRFILVDRDSMFAFLIQDERTIRGEGETALWTNSPDFVKAHLEIFEKAWTAAVRGKSRMADLRARAR